LLAVQLTSLASRFTKQARSNRASASLGFVLFFEGGVGPGQSNLNSIVRYGMGDKSTSAKYNISL